MNTESLIIKSYHPFSLAKLCYSEKPNIKKLNIPHFRSLDIKQMYKFKCQTMSAGLFLLKTKQTNKQTHTQDLRNQFTLYELYSNLLAKDYC